MSNVRTNARSRRVVVAVAGAALTLVLAACTAPTPPTTTTTTSSTVPSCVPEPATLTQGSVTLTVSKVTCLEVGAEVAVTGSGYTATGNIGTRFPLPGQPAGVYVAFGEFADNWRYSESAPSSARKILSQMWALPSPSFENVGGGAGLTHLAADGTFSTTLTISEAQGANPNLAFVTYAGSGAVNPAEELFIPASWLAE